MAPNRLPRLLRVILFVWSLVDSYVTSDEFPATTPGLPTVTVRGFLNFLTTVDGTVIVFTPDVSPTSVEPKHASFSAVTEDAQEWFNSCVPTISTCPLETFKTHLHEENVLENKIILPHISDNAVLLSVGHGNELDKMKKLQSSPNQYPTGLVTVLGGTFVTGTSTTVYETKVIGTYIDGKYAQILQSTSSIVHPPSHSTTFSLNYFTATNTENSEILKETPLTPTGGDLFHSHQTTRSKSLYIESEVVNLPIFTKLIDPTSTVLIKDISATDINSFLGKDSTNEKHQISISAIKIDETVTLPDFSQETSIMANLESSFTVTLSGIQDASYPTESLDSSLIRESSTPSFIRLSDNDGTNDGTTASRNSTSRSRFLPPRRPSQTVRLNRFKVKLTLRQDDLDASDDDDLEHKDDGEGEDVSIAFDAAPVVFQQTIITSEVTLHVGRKKSVRTLTITTSIPLTVNPTDIQDILSAQSTAMDRSVNNRHILTNTFTTTERALKTSVVPIFDGKSTMYHTVTESFFIMKLITAYRTLPPGDPSILELFLQPTTTLESTQLAAVDQVAAEDTVQSTLYALPENSQPHITHPLISLGYELSNNPLAAVYLGLHQFNAQMTLFSTVISLSTYVTTETAYKTKKIPIYDGRSIRNRIISDRLSTTKRTLITTVTSIQPYLNTHAVQQQQQLQKLIAATQLSPSQSLFSTITSAYTTVTTATSLNTRIYTLIYNGFSTKFRTVTSSTLYPTTVTITSTNKLPIAPSQVNLPLAFS